MITMPKRSVTRFFIPMIDILILLFCIFLMMPVVRGTGDLADGAPQRPLSDPERQELERLREFLRNPQSLTEKERAELEKLRREKIQPLQDRLAIRTLEIDGDTGRLYHYDLNRSPERIEIANEADALFLIDRHKKATQGKGAFFLILRPRKLSGYPESSQIKRYEGWFKGVAHGYEDPKLPK